MPLESGPDKRENVLELPSSRTPRILWWLLYHPKLTGDIIINSALELGILQRLESGRISLNKLNEPVQDQWLALRRKCTTAIGIDNPEAYESALVRDSPVFRQWKKNLLDYQHREGINQL